MVRASWRQSKTAPRAFFFWSMGFGCDKLITARRPEKKVDCRMKAAKHPARKRIAFLLKARAVAQKATESGRERRVPSRDSLATKRELLICVRLRHSRTSARKTLTWTLHFLLRHRQSSRRRQRSLEAAERYLPCCQDTARSRSTSAVHTAHR